MTYYSALHYAAKAEAAATTATTLLPYLTDITTVATSIASVNTVSTNISDVTTAATNISSINTVATNISDVNSVASNITNINTVSTNISDVNSVATDISNVNSVAGDLTNIDAVNANKTNIDAVAGNETNINAVANNSININTVAGNTTNINTVAGDLTNINAVAADLTNIDNASTYAAEAKQWAIGDPTEPVDGSAKYWAQQAAGQVIPSQTGHSGEYLTTDGSALSWNNVDALPDQTGQAGKFLTTDGSTASWATASVTVDQVYDSTSTNAQSGVAINGAKFIQNTATGTNALTVGGTASTKVGTVNVGVGSSATANYSVVIGHNAKGQASSATALGRSTNASGSFSVALGYGAACSGGKSIQLGYGTNSTATSLSVGFQDVGNYQLLDGTTGLIPHQRLPIDSKSITNNSSDQLQAIGIIDQNNPANALKVWHGTQAEYDALATHDANTRYYTDGGLNASLLDVIYPVGSIYITTNSSCPLSTLIAGSTWVLVGQDRVLQGAGTRGVVGTTLNESLPNITGYAPTNYWTALADESPNNCCTTSEYSKTVTLLATGGIATTNWKIDASRSSSAYQDNAPVQPDAYLVNIYRRIL